MKASFDQDLVLHSPAIAVLGRVMFTLIFFASGITHFTDMQSYVNLMPAAIPLRPFWVVISGFVELAGATMILLNRYPKLGAWMIAIFLVPVTITVHGVLMMTALDEAMQRIQLSFFLKGVTMAGAALIFTQVGVAAGQRNP